MSGAAVSADARSLSLPTGYDIRVSVKSAMVTPLPATERVRSAGTFPRSAAAILILLGCITGAEAAPPRIRTDAGNAVPRCVTPQRLMAFLKTRNASLDPRFANIASFYKKYGETWNVRWDYAFFQMALETNFLTYRRGDGRWGDVDPKQNNFAGLGTTGGGVPGDSYPDVGTGVLAQIQHLVVYSGERIANPVGARTRLKQDDILAAMASKKGRTTFGDLARRWAADRNYGSSIEWVATSFRQSYCKGGGTIADAAEETAPAAAPNRTATAQVDARKVKTARANLGGPVTESQPAPPPRSPVRTVWSASDQGNGALRTAVAETPATEPAPKAPASRTVPAPTRKPAVVARIDGSSSGDRVVVAEQMIQTGEEPRPMLQVATAAAAAIDPSASEAATSIPSVSGPPAYVPPASATDTTTQEAATSRLAAFAFAAGMATNPKAQPPPPAGKAAPSTANTSACRITSASYGGKKALLIRTGTAPAERYTVLTVLEGFEKSMLANYLKAHAPAGESLGEFATREDALQKAKELCPGGATASPRNAGVRTG